MAVHKSPDFPRTITFGALQTKHPAYDAKYWEILRGLYQGGQALLGSKCFEEIFPKHMSESDEVYRERKKRSFYLNYPGEIVDHITASLMMHPVQVASKEKHDEFYDDFVKDTSPRGGQRTPLHRFTWQQVRGALTCGMVWTLVDFPPNVEFLNEELSEAAQVKSGALDAYAISIDPELVFDWEQSPDGEILWAKLCVDKQKRSFDTKSATITKEYTIYRAHDWARYSITFDPTKNPPSDATAVSLSDQGLHSFERVPVLPFILPEALWVMNKLAAVAIEHMNKRSALAWAEYKSLFAERYEFLDDAQGPAECSTLKEDAERAVNQVRGQGYTQVRAQGDRVEYVGPPTEAFDFALKNLTSLKDEMHRVTHQMALSVDVGASAVRRSGDSKEQDRKDSVVVLNALGQLVREHVFQIFNTISVGRNDDLTWTIKGLDEFDDVDVTGVLGQAALVKELDIPSPTFKTEYKSHIAHAVLAERVPVDVMKKVESEIKEAFKDEKPETADARMLRQMQQAPGPLENQFGKEPFKNRDGRPKPNKGDE